MKRLSLLAGALLAALAGCGGGDSNSADACEAFCGTLDACGFGLMSGPCVPSCEAEAQQTAEISSACGEAFDAEGLCVGALSCEELDDWIDDTPESPCVAEDAAVTAACNP